MNERSEEHQSEFRRKLADPGPCFCSTPWGSPLHEQQCEERRIHMGDWTVLDRAGRDED